MEHFRWGEYLAPANKLGGRPIFDQCHIIKFKMSTMHAYSGFKLYKKYKCICPWFQDILRKFNASEGVDLASYIDFINDYIIVKHQSPKMNRKCMAVLGSNSSKTIYSVTSPP